MNNRKLYVWPKRGFLAIAYAETTSSARQLLLEEINSDGSDGSFPAVARAVEAVRAHTPQIFAYQDTAEFVVTDSGALEASEKAEKELLHAAENLYALVDALCGELLTDEGRRQVREAYEALRANGSKMFPPSWDAVKLPKLGLRCGEPLPPIRVWEGLCEDEGCPQAGTDHVCFSSAMEALERVRAVLLARLGGSNKDDNHTVMGLVDRIVAKEGVRPIYAAYTDEVPSLTMEAHEVCDEVSQETVVAMWRKLRERHEEATELLRRLRDDGPLYNGGGPFEVHCRRCKRAEKDGHRSGCLTGDLEEFFAPPPTADCPEEVYCDSSLEDCRKFFSLKNEEPPHVHVFDSAPWLEADFRVPGVNYKIGWLRCACGEARTVASFGSEY